MRVYIIGITGVGKSTVGKRLARKLGYGFVDLDAWIEIRENKKIADLFDEGENNFRQAETASLKSLKFNRNLVVATGGGIVTQEENIKYMRRTGFVILLERPLDTIAKTVNTDRRPLLKDGADKLYALYHQRKNAYLSAMHIKVKCHHRQKAILRLVNEVKKYENKNYKRAKLEQARH